MARTNAILTAFNRGEIGQPAMGRVDVDRIRLSADEQTNWVPRTAGPMSIRPGLGYIGAIKSGAIAVRHLPFVFSMTDMALIECTPGVMRVLVAEAPITRPSVASVVPSGDMSSGAGWTVAAEGGATATWAGGDMVLNPVTIGGYVKVDASFGCNTPNVEHALRIEVTRGPVRFRCGHEPDSESYIAETTLGTGTHSLAFTPGAPTIYVQFATLDRTAIVTNCTIEAAGAMEIPAFWSGATLPYIRPEQSGDVIYLATLGEPQYKIERRGTRSWSLVRYEVDDGPFAAFNTNGVRLTFTDSHGNITVEADRPVFRPGHAGAIIRAFTPDYTHDYAIGADLHYTPPVRVSGVGATRDIVYNVTWAAGGSGTWSLERSFDDEFSGYAPVTTGTLNTSTTLNDGYSNTVAWYRLGFQAGALTAGYATMSITKQGGGRTARARITGYTGPQHVSAEVLDLPSSNQWTDDWRLSEWSADAGYPSAVAIFDGRLCWSGRDRLWASVSDGYESFADTLDNGEVGDSSAISRSIGYGPVAVINWLLPLTRLVAGSEGSEISIRSSSLDAPITPTGGMTIRDCSTQGSARVAAVKSDTRGLFVQKSQQRLYQLAYDINLNDYQAADLNRLHPDLNLGNAIKQIVIQRQPETRIHCLRNDGTVVVLTFEPLDEVIAWWRVETDGTVIDMAVLPGTIEDSVYYTVGRVSGGSTTYCLEKFARFDECRGGALNRIADSHVSYSGTATTTMPGLTHLAGRTVVLWGNQKDLGTAVVNGAGQVAFPEAVTSAVAGLPYEARFKSSKLAYAAQGGTAIAQIKRVSHIGLVLADTHPEALTFGQDFTTMDAMPLIENEDDVDTDALWTTYDEPMIELPGDWDTDARLCLKASAPRPATVQCAVLTVTTSG